MSGGASDAWNSSITDQDKHCTPAGHTPLCRDFLGMVKVREENDGEEKSVKRVHSGMTGEKKRTSVHGPCLDNEHGTGFGSTQA